MNRLLSSPPPNLPFEGGGAAPGLSPNPAQASTSTSPFKGEARLGWSHTHKPISGAPQC